MKLEREDRKAIITIAVLVVGLGVLIAALVSAGTGSDIVVARTSHGGITLTGWGWLLVLLLVAD